MKTRSCPAIPAVLAPAILLAVASCAPVSSQPRPGPVPAGFLFEGPVVDMRAPDSDGWHVVGHSSRGMEFARRGRTENRTFGAQVLIAP